MPRRSSALAWRKASPDPSASWTNPYLLSGLNHLTLPETGGSDGSSICGSVDGDGTSELSSAWIEPTSSTAWCRSRRETLPLSRNLLIASSMCASPVMPDSGLSRLWAGASSPPPIRWAGSAAPCPRATPRGQCRNLRQPIDDLVEIEREPTAPIGMAVGRTGQVRLLAFADTIFKLNRHWT